MLRCSASLKMPCLKTSFESLAPIVGEALRRDALIDAEHYDRRGRRKCITCFGAVRSLIVALPVGGWEGWCEEGKATTPAPCGSLLRLGCERLISWLSNVKRDVANVAAQ